MDLGTCPKCGRDWVAGAERCGQCGFVPIGAGLRELPKKVRKPSRYREPGSMRGLLVTAFICCSIGVLAVNQPWQNDWAGIRGLLGQPVASDLRGNWRICRTVVTRPSVGLLVPNGTADGRVVFGPAGRVAFQFALGQVRSKVSGTYEVRGAEVVFNDLRGGAEANLPPRLIVKLVWTDRDSFVANVGNSELVFVRRETQQESISKAVQGFNKTSPEGEVDEN